MEKRRKVDDKSFLVEGTMTIDYETAKNIEYLKSKLFDCLVLDKWREIQHVPYTIMSMMFYAKQKNDITL